MFGMKINLTIDFEWLKHGFEKCNVEWDGTDNDADESSADINK
jgi:hypothetical protein